MYLFVFVDGTTRQVFDNLTVADVLALSQGLLKLYTVRDGKFVEITTIGNTLKEIPVLESHILMAADGRLHHT